MSTDFIRVTAWICGNAIHLTVACVGSIFCLFALMCCRRSKPVDSKARLWNENSIFFKCARIQVIERERERKLFFSLTLAVLTFTNDISI